MELAERVLCVLRDIGTKASPEEISSVAQGLQEEVLKHVDSTGKSRSVSEEGARSALVVLLLESCKHQLSTQEVSRFLNEQGWTPRNIEAWAKFYNEAKGSVIQVLSSLGNEPPSVVDASWKMDVCLENSGQSKVNEPQWLISLKTLSQTEAFPKDLKFFCKKENLADLVAKLRDAAKCVEKHSS